MAVNKMEIYFKEGRKKNLAYTWPLAPITLENKDGVRARNESLLKIYWVDALIFCGTWMRVGEWILSLIHSPKRILSLLIVECWHKNILFMKLWLGSTWPLCLFSSFKANLIYFFLKGALESNMSIMNI